MNSQIDTEAELEIVLNAVREYYACNAVTRLGRNLTVFQLLRGAVDVATYELREAKAKVRK
jgi:hypothetical protein